MREDQMPYPGVLTNSLQLRKECAKAISHVQVNTVEGKNDQAATLKAFFTACASALDSLIAGTPPAED